MIIIHRINTIAELNKIPPKYGVEIDVRGYGRELLLSHDPIDPEMDYDSLKDYLSHFHHAFVIFNIKEAGYEEEVIALARERNIQNYFLLDCEFPFIYRATRVDSFSKIAVRFSEAEPLEVALAQKGENGPLVDWVWIDTNTLLPLTPENVPFLADFKTCLVCPDRWGRPQDIPSYITQIMGLKFPLTAVMTSLQHAPLYENSGIFQ